MDIKLSQSEICTNIFRLKPFSTERNNRIKHETANYVKDMQKLGERKYAEKGGAGRSQRRYAMTRPTFLNLRHVSRTQGFQRLAHLPF